MTPEPEDDTAGAASSSASDNENAEVSEMADQKDQGNGSKTKAGTSNGSSSVANAKDPTRPRRKKARRACFACQRAHLTCGDERPCQRCIKRGLQDSCHDGMRKKAKYLHDAPNEALMPGVGGSHFSHLQNVRGANAMSGNASSTDSTPVVGNQSAFYPSNQPGPTSAYGLYPPNPPQGHMAPPLQDYGQQPPPISPPLHSGHSQQSASLSALSGALPQPSPNNQGQPQSTFGEPLFDPSNPAFFNFDLASLNFGNRYGAMEFGMLGHMSSGATDPSTGDSSGALGQGAGGFMSGPSVYGQSPGSGNYVFSQDPMDWQGGNGSRQGSTGNVYKNGGDMSGRGANPNIAHGFTIGASSLTSPSSASSPQAMLAGFDGSPMNTFYPSNPAGGGQQQNLSRPSSGTKQHHAPRNSPHNDRTNTQSRRPQGPSSIYETVKQPYSYTAGFHGLTACLQRRFSPQKTLRIAKSLASIRPSFISSTKNLNREDLVFMEKCFQRTLWEYENDFINACGTPTIVCRRTGEVAAVGKEFSLLTGWKKDILLGKEANLNINTGGTSGRPSSGVSTGKGGFNTPRIPGAPKPEGLEGDSRPQPVFLAELLDDESVIGFYEDFSKLAFGDSRGSVTTRCKLMTYKSKEDSGHSREEDVKMEEEDRHLSGKRSSAKGHQQQHKSNPANIKKMGLARDSSFTGLESQDGKVECSYCWTVKRDVFDIPMLIVMNVRHLISSSSRDCL
ncbi:MAG: Transcriptional regulator of nonfermentable carbon utilization [Sclerophora amabilis]|nr:MAG: Transcriptional regulator of nonfermentable carbon utilization [Sclerophora amabilis]